MWKWNAKCRLRHKILICSVCITFFLYVFSAALSILTNHAHFCWAYECSGQSEPFRLVIDETQEFWLNSLTDWRLYSVLPSLWFWANTLSFNTVAAGCFSCLQVKATPLMWYLAPGMHIFTGGPFSKHDWASFWLVLSSNWAGFVVKTWQLWLYCTLTSSLIMNYKSR